MKKNYIKHNIQTVYAKKLISPLIFLFILSLLWGRFTFADFLFPVEIVAETNAETYLAEQGIEYVSTSLDSLYYTGYTCSRFNKTVGYYYYTQASDGTYLFFLLSPSECQEGQGELKNLPIRGKIVKGGYDYQILLTAMADKINWTYTGISEASGAYYVSTPDYAYGSSMALLLLILFTGSYALICILLYLIYVAIPALSPPCRQLKRYGNGKELMRQAEEELSTLPQLATEDMFITEHFFIEVSNYGIAVIPISEIVWIYKHSTLQQFSPKHMKLSYTLRIYGKHHLNFDCPRNTKSDIDGIMDYLCEANHDIIEGFSEENMKLAKERRAL